MPDEVKKLYRSRKNRMLFGVCGGVGDYFHTDPTIIRVLFVLAAIFAGCGIILYIAMALIVPEEPEAV